MIAVLNAYTLSECMEIMADYAAAYESRGGRNLIFCEDRLTLIAEQALTRKTGGTFFSSVTTFARFLKTDERILTKQGSVMAIGEIMTELQRKRALKCFTSASGIKNNAKCIYETVAQLAASEVTPETLAESLSLLPQDMLKDKVSDLAAIYEGYTAFLREKGYVDESRYLSLLPDCIRRDANLRGTNIFFLCFTSFTAQAAEAIRAAAEAGANVLGIFCSGKEEIYTNRAFSAFTKACEGYGKVQVRSLGTPLEGEAEVLRAGLFNPERLAGERMKTDKIRIFEAEDKSGEAEYIAANIKKLLAERPALRYRDIAVLVPDMAGYSLPFKKTFDEYGIPWFFDEKKSLKRHPLSRFLLSCFAAVREGYSPAAVQGLTQNVFFGPSDAYRNYLLKFANYRGGAKREIKTGELVDAYNRAELEACRERLLQATRGIPRKARGKEYCRAVRRILSEFSVEEKLKELSESVGETGYGSYLSQISGALKRVLDEAELLTGEREMTASEFETVLADGLDATDISLIPLKADAVFVGDITDSRIEKVRVLFAAGMTDDVPRNADDTALVSDREIERLAEVKTLLEPTVAEVNLRSRESASLNLCTFTDMLCLSYPLAADGSEPSLSDVFRYVDGLFADKKGLRLQAEKKLPDADFKYKCSAVSPAIRELLIKKNEYERCREDTRREYSSLYAALEILSVEERNDYLEKCEGQVRVECGERLFFRDGQISPTMLESYFCCPFCNFASQGLKLKEREETAVMAADSGNFVHALLERTTPKLGDCATEAEARAYAEEAGRELLKKPLYAAQADTAAGGYSSDSLLAEGMEVAAAVFRQLKGSAYRVEETEKAVSTPAFRGKIDRVDGTGKFVRVIDYKTGNIDDSPLSYYTGRKLQLQLYMSAVKGGRVPAGVFYFPASVSYSKTEEGKFRMKGFLNGDEEALLSGDVSLGKGGKSEFFDAQLKDNSRLDKVMDEETFRNFLDYAVYEARQGSEELKNGFIAPTPYKGECTYCRYGGMCGFNYDLTPERVEESIKPKTIAEIARRHRDGEDNAHIDGKTADGADMHIDGKTAEGEATAYIDDKIAEERNKAYIHHTTADEEAKHE